MGRQSMAVQIVRLLNAIDNRCDPLAYSEPLVARARDRYGDLRTFDFEGAALLSRAEAVEAFMARGTPLVEPAAADALDDPIARLHRVQNARRQRTAEASAPPPQRPASGGEGVAMGRSHLTRADWIAQAKDRYGADSLKWRFRCPVCGIVTAVEKWREAKAPEGAIAFSCVGRYLPGEVRDAFFGRASKGPCNYAGGGVFRINPVVVTDEEGREHTVFDFADRPLSAPPTPTGSPAR